MNFDITGTFWKIRIWSKAGFSYKEYSGIESKDRATEIAKSFIKDSQASKVEIYRYDVQIKEYKNPVLVIKKGGMDENNY